MLPIQTIFGLPKNQEPNTLIKVVSKTNIGDVLPGTPLMTSVENIETNVKGGFDPETSDFSINVYNPRVLTCHNTVNFRSCVRFSSVVMTKKKPFIVDHKILTASDTAEVDSAVHLTAEGGSATLFVNDMALIKELLENTLPQHMQKYKYIGRLTAGPTTLARHFENLDQDRALVIRLFNPAQCCIVYRPEALEGLVWDVGVVSLKECAQAEDLLFKDHTSFFCCQHESLMEVDGAQLVRYRPLDIRMLTALMPALEGPKKRKKVSKCKAVPSSKYRKAGKPANMVEAMAALNNGESEGALRGLARVLESTTSDQPAAEHFYAVRHGTNTEPDNENTAANMAPSDVTCVSTGTRKEHAGVAPGQYEAAYYKTVTSVQELRARKEMLDARFSQERVTDMEWPTTFEPLDEEDQAVLKEAPAKAQTEKKQKSLKGLKKREMYVQAYGGTWTVN